MDLLSHYSITSSFWQTKFAISANQFPQIVHHMVRKDAQTLDIFSLMHTAGHEDRLDAVVRPQPDVRFQIVSDQDDIFSMQLKLLQCRVLNSFDFLIYPSRSHKA